MKKIYIFAFCIIFLFVFLCQKESPTEKAQSFSAGEYYFFVEGEQEKGNFYSAIKNGSQTVLNCPLYEARERKSEIKGKILGESFCIVGNDEEARAYIDKINAKVLFCSETAGIYNYYLYADSIKGASVNLFGQKVNAQVAVAKGKVHVGFPILLGGY